MRFYSLIILNKQYRWYYSHIIPVVLDIDSTMVYSGVVTLVVLTRCCQQTRSMNISRYPRPEMVHQPASQPASQPAKATTCETSASSTAHRLSVPAPGPQGAHHSLRARPAGPDRCWTSARSQAPCRSEFQRDGVKI